MSRNSFLPYRNLIAALLVFLGAICFSAKAVIVKLAYQYDVDSVSLLALRMIFSLPVFLLVAFFDNKMAKAQRNSLSKRDWLKIFFFGIVGYYLASLFDFLGLQYLTASLERLILFLYPTIVVLIVALFFRKPITRSQGAALAITYVGIAIVFADRTALQDSSNLVLGSFLIFLAALTYAIYLVGSGSLLPRIGTLRYTSIAMSAACIAVIIHHGISLKFQLFNFHPHVYYLSLLMAVLSTALPAFLVSEGIRIIGSSNAAIIGSVGPISTIVLAYIFLGERLGWLQWIGAILVILGVLIISLQKEKQLQD